MGLNLELMIGGQINSIVPKLPINILTFDTQTIDASGVPTVTYTTTTTISSSQLASNQNLMHKDYYQETEVYRTFYIQSNVITGLNRNLSIGGDYIQTISDGLYWKIVEVPEQFLTGWSSIIACQSTFVGG